MEYVIAPPQASSLAVQGAAGRFPVRRVYCVGRNYEDHAREMGASGREPPFFFAKPGDAVLGAGVGEELTLPWPGRTGDLQHEVELVLALGAGGRDLSLEDAGGCIWGLAVGIDLTRRDLQREMKERRWPWEVAKGFDGSAPVGAIAPLPPGSQAPARGAIWLDVNGVRRQQGDLSQMIWSAGEILAHLSGYFELAPGDLVFTGTPAGVAALAPGDLVECGVECAGAGALRLRLRAGTVAQPAY
jgi:fumarylpyruvate hydrolase